MTDTAHTFRTGDGSLGHRVNEYLTAAQALARVQQSANFASDPSWSDRLGGTEDIAAAEKILERSLSRASAAIKTHEMPVAIAKGLLSDEQAREFAKLRLQQDFDQSGQKPTSSGQKQS